LFIEWLFFGKYKLSFIKNGIKNQIEGLYEPFTFTGLGYLVGYYALGRFRMYNYLPALHHITLCQEEVTRRICKNLLNAFITTSIFYSYVAPFINYPKQEVAARRVYALMNRLHIKPLLGMGYPVRELLVLK
jgi:beta-glucosidase